MRATPAAPSSAPAPAGGSASCADVQPTGGRARLPAGAAPELVERQGDWKAGRMQASSTCPPAPPAVQTAARAHRRRRGASAAWAGWRRQGGVPPRAAAAAPSRMMMWWLPAPHPHPRPRPPPPPPPAPAWMRSPQTAAPAPRRSFGGSAARGGWRRRGGAPPPAGAAASRRRSRAWRLPAAPTWRRLAASPACSRRRGARWGGWGAGRERLWRLAGGGVL